MEHSHSASYAAAGVNIEAGYEGVRLMKQHVERTFIPGVVSEIGGFGGLFAPSLEGLREPVPAGELLLLSGNVVSRVGNIPGDLSIRHGWRVSRKGAL